MFWGKFLMGLELSGGFFFRRNSTWGIVLQEKFSIEEFSMEATFQWVWHKIFWIKFYPQEDFQYNLKNN